MFENEQWREIDELPHYLISTHGRVKLGEDAKARKVSINDRGFPIITLYGRDSKSRYLRQINVLVANAFLELPLFDEPAAVWHIDGDLQNCHVDNLKWETRVKVLEWNEMHRLQEPRMGVVKVRNNRTGRVYKNAFECAMAEGKVESEIIWYVEKQALSMEDDHARYRYLFERHQF